MACLCIQNPNALSKKKRFLIVFGGRGVRFLVKYFRTHNAPHTFHDRIWISMLRRNCTYFRGKILDENCEFFSRLFLSRILIFVAHFTKRTWVWFIVLEWAFYWRWTSIEKRWTMAEEPRAHSQWMDIPHELFEYDLVCLFAFAAFFFRWAAVTVIVLFVS